MTGKGGFGTEFIEELKTKNEIIQTIGKYVPLERKGRDFWGRCPFHHEKTPSFKVDPSRQFYHCFGCGVSGDVIKFVQEMESCDFMEAVKILAASAGMQMPDVHENGEVAAQKQKKERLLKLLKDTARFYHSALMSDVGKTAQNYLVGRGVSRETVTKFGLGYSPGFNEGVPSSVEHLSRLGYTYEELTEAGVAVISEKTKRPFDALFGRLVFPLFNSYGDVIGFGGRVLEKTDFAKYKNTGDTMLFDKKKNLYAVNFLKKLKRDKGIESVIVVEGYMDTIALHQAGFLNVVASMGTSLTKEQARLLKRFTDRVYICYDGDGAGQKATIRGLDILKSEGLEVKVVSMPEGLDPDEVVRDFGVEGYQKFLTEASPLVDFKLKTLKKFYDLSGYDKRAFIRSALKVVAEIDSSAEQEDCLKLLREDTGYSLESLRRDLENSKTPSSEPVLRAEPGGEEKGEEKALRYILCYYLSGKGNLTQLEAIRRFVPDGVYRTVYDYVLGNLQAGKSVAPSMLFELVSDEEFPQVTRILTAADTIPEEGRETFLSDCVNNFRRTSLEERLRALTAEFEAEDDVMKRKEVAKNIQELTRQLRD